MRVRVNNSVTTFYEPGDYIEPLDTDATLLVATDPSKSNFALIIGTVSGQILRMIEFSGNDSDYFSRAMDTTGYCERFETYILALLATHDVYEVGVEKPVMYKKKKDGSWGKGGMGHYQSQMVLTEIRARMMSVGKAISGKRTEEINNFAWKGAVLPDGYRGQHEKGSKRFLTELDPKFVSYTDDITDCICIYQYMLMQYREKAAIACDRAEEPRFGFKMSIVDKQSLPQDVKYFKFNDTFDCKQNATYFANRMKVVGACKVPISLIKLEDLYLYARNLLPTSEPFLLVERVG